jgi:hypothetical protein
VSALKEWRQRKKEANFFQAAQMRSKTMLEGEIVANIELALMAAGQAASRYRQSIDKDSQEIQLYEIRMQLEAALGMLDNALPLP